MKRRPTAFDRDIVDLLCEMREGTYEIKVSEVGRVIRYMRLAEVKAEGRLVPIEQVLPNGKIIEIRQK